MSRFADAVMRDSTYHHQDIRSDAGDMNRGVLICYGHEPRLNGQKSQSHEIIH